MAHTALTLTATATPTATTRLPLLTLPQPPSLQNATAFYRFHQTKDVTLAQCPSYLTTDLAALTTCIRSPIFVAPGETLSASAYEIFPGGKGLNQSIAAAKAGARVSHIGAIGEDGQHLKTLLAAQSVETSHLAMEPSASGHAIIQINDAGENAIVIFGGTNLGEHQTLLEQGLEQGSSEDWLLIQNETSCNQQAIEFAKSHGMQVAFNMAPMNERRALSLPLSEIDLFIVNETEGAALTGERDAERILDAIASTYPNAQVALTLGDQGAWYQSRSARSFAPAAKATVLDTTGAGDTFTGFSSLDYWQWTHQ